METKITLYLIMKAFSPMPFQHQASSSTSEILISSLKTVPDGRWRHFHRQKKNKKIDSSRKARPLLSFHLLVTLGLQKSCRFLITPPNGVTERRRGGGKQPFSMIQIYSFSPRPMCLVTPLCGASPLMKLFVSQTSGSVLTLSVENRRGPNGKLRRSAA